MSRTWICSSVSEKSIAVSVPFSVWWARARCPVCTGKYTARLGRTNRHLARSSLDLAHPECDDTVIVSAAKSKCAVMLETQNPPRYITVRQLDLHLLPSPPEPVLELRPIVVHQRALL